MGLVWCINVCLTGQMLINEPCHNLCKINIGGKPTSLLEITVLRSTFALWGQKLYRFKQKNCAFPVDCRWPETIVLTDASQAQPQAYFLFF